MHDTITQWSRVCADFHGGVWPVDKAGHGRSEPACGPGNGRRVPGFKFAVHYIGLRGRRVQTHQHQALHWQSSVPTVVVLVSDGALGEPSVILLQ